MVYLLQKSNKKAIIKADVLRWNGVYIPTSGFVDGFIFHLCFYPEFRNLFYYRIGAISNLLNIYCGKMKTLYLSTPIIGEGLFIQHGFATVIAAKSVGKNCWINQQVTVGFSNKDDCPIIEDNVTINAGAKVIGGIVVGSSSLIGANAVVVKNVPQNCVVVGVPAYIIKRNGIKVNEKL
jgi:serine O-acetyltransferase